MKKHLLLFFLGCLYVNRLVIAQPGRLDLSLNGNGLATFSFKQNVSQDFVTATFLQADGKLLITGYDTLSQREGFAIRLLANGSLDKNFGKNGKVYLDEEFSLSRFIPNALTVYEDGTGDIIIAGHLQLGNPVISTTPTLVCLTNEGIKKNMFGSNGSATFTNIVSGNGATFRTVQIHKTTGNVLAAGGTNSIQDFSSTFAIVSCDRNGNFTAFNDFSGYKLYSVDGGRRGQITSSVILDSDTMYIAGNTWDDNGFSSIAVASVNMLTGEVGPNYQSLGSIIALSKQGYSNNSCEAIALTAGKSLLLSGSAYNFSDSLFIVRKLKPALISNDTSFGLNGDAFTNVATTGDERGYTLAVGSDGKIMQGGFYTEGGLKKWVIVQLKANGTIENTFGTAGILKPGKTTNASGPLINSLSNGSYILSGNFVTAGTGASDVIVKKINSNGSSDNSYGTNSESKVWVRDANTLLKDIIVKSDGKILLIGNIIKENLQRAGVALLNADGTPDGSFGGLNGADPGVVFLPDSLPNMLLFLGKQLNNGKMLLAGVCHSSLPAEQEDIFLMRLNSNGIIDNTFNGTKGYVRVQDDSLSGADYPHSILIQSNDKIIVTGVLKIGNDRMAVMRFNAAGSLDMTFAGGKGIHLDDSSDVSEPDVFGAVKAVLQPDDKIVFSGSHDADGETTDMAVLRLTKDGLLDATFGVNGKYKHDFDGSNDEATCIALKPNGSIVVGGYGIKNGTGQYALVQLKTNGMADTLFGTKGTVLFGKGYDYQQLMNVSIENDRIVAMGIAQGSDDKIYTTALRYTATGELDRSFLGQGHHLVSEGYATQALLSGSSYYILGSTKFVEEPRMIGFVAKLKLGTGPVIKTTSLNLANLVKTYGDEPFLLKPISNSAAPVRYAVTTSGSSCATVHPTTGLVKLTCGTPFGYVQIMAIQDAVSGYTADTAYAQIKINRAIPTIVFPNQGGVYVSGPDKDTITLSYSSNSDGYFYFNKMTFDTVISQSGESNVVAITGIGESIVRLTYDQTDNYESHYVEAKVLGSIVLKAPEANEDNAVMIYGQQTKITFNVLSNDESYAGSLEASLIDLDPSTQEIDHIYLSSSLGYFEADTTGLITYIPFSGFIGSGFITYTIRDSKGSVSAPAKIAVEVTLQGEAPALRATELITPNNDGLNDAFVIGNIVLGKTNQLKIFDRNGAELFTKNDYANDWRGELSNGKQVENGIYYYLFVEGDVGNQRELKGVVELRR